MEINSKILFKSDCNLNKEDFVEMIKRLYNHLSDEYSSLIKNKDTDINKYTAIFEYIIYALEFIDLYKIPIDEKLLHKYDYLASVIFDYSNNTIKKNIIESIKNNKINNDVDYSKLTKEQLIELLKKKNK